MGAVSLLSLSSTLPLLPPSPPRPFSSNPPQTLLPPPPPRRRTAVAVGRKAGPDESRFFDEDGVVRDMDGYLNYLSLEYDSVWDTKPAWCQPWTILLTGITVASCSWIFLHSALVTAIISSLICVWWYTFLYVYPKAYSDMIADRREKVDSGAEDTFGVQNTQ